MKNQEYTVCARCKVSQLDKKLSFEPSMHSLIFGGFNSRMEYRCEDCEKEVCKLIDEMLSNIKVSKLEIVVNG